MPLENTLYLLNSKTFSDLKILIHYVMKLVALIVELFYPLIHIWSTVNYVNNITFHHCYCLMVSWRVSGGGGGGVLPEKLGAGVRPASQNPYPIYDQNLRNSLPYI